MDATELEAAHANLVTAYRHQKPGGGYSLEHQQRIDLHKTIVKIEEKKPVDAAELTSALELAASILA